MIERSEIDDNGKIVVIDCGYEYLYRKPGCVVSARYYFFNCSRLTVKINDHAVDALEPHNATLKEISKKERAYVAFTQTHNTESSEYHANRSQELLSGYLREYVSIVRRHSSLLLKTS